MSAKTKRLLPRLALGAASMLLFTLAATSLLDAAGVDLERRLWLLRRNLLGLEPVGIWQPSPVFGWTHRPGASGRDRVPPDFDVAYHIPVLTNRSEYPTHGARVLALRYRNQSTPDSGALR